MELFCNFGPDAAPVQKRLRHLKKRRLVPLVPLWVPNATSASLEKKGRLLPFVSLILAPNTWSRHGFSQSNSGPKRASPGSTLGAKRRL